MAVINVKRRWEQRTSQVDDRLQRTYRVPYLVETDSELDGPETVLAALGVSMHQPYISFNGAEDQGSLVRAISCSPHDNHPRLWMVVVEYGSVGMDPARQAANPVDRPPTVTWDNTFCIRPAVFDIFNQPIANSAGEPLLGLEMEDQRVTIQVQRYVESFDENLAFEFFNSLNLNTFLGRPPLTWRCTRYNGVLTYENGLPVWRVDFSAEYRPEGWAINAQDAGYYEMIDGVRKEIIDVYQHRPSSPVPLNGYGRKLEDAHSTLVYSITAGDDEMEVDDASVFPGAPFRVKIDDEEILVTSYTGGDPGEVTISRAQNNTEAATHDAGAVVQQLPYYLEFHVYKRRDFDLLGILPA